MKLTLERFTNNGHATLSLLFVDGVFNCFGLEDEPREIKVSGETRIPAGEYQINLRAEGGMTQRYARRFPTIHEGMLWLQDVPNFEWVYIHIGNREDHTDGCILTGQTASAASMTVGMSTAAYEALYRKVRNAARDGDLSIEIIDRDTE